MPPVAGPVEIDQVRGGRRQPVSQAGIESVRGTSSASAIGTLLQRQLIAQADVDAAQVAFDSDVAQHTATAAQEGAQAALVQSGEAQLKVAEAQLQSTAAQVGQYEAALRSVRYVTLTGSVPSGLPNLGFPIPGGAPSSGPSVS